VTPAPGPESLLHGYAAALAATDVFAFRALWDETRPPFYVVDEIHEPMLAWEDVDDQWRRLAARVSSAHAEVELLRVEEVGDDGALVYGVLAWRFAGVDADDVRAGHSRLVAVCRRAPDWRLAALVEAPLHLQDGATGPSEASPPEAR
jgi:hypothetical protein